MQRPVPNVYDPILGRQTIFNVKLIYLQHMCGPYMYLRNQGQIQVEKDPVFPKRWIWVHSCCLLVLNALFDAQLKQGEVANFGDPNLNTE